MQDQDRTPATRPDNVTGTAPRTPPQNDQSAPAEETLRIETLEERIAPAGCGSATGPRYRG